MKYLAAAAVVLGVLLTARAETVADAGHSDPVCPDTAHAVRTYADLARLETTRVVDAVSAANAASTAFDRCADRYRSAGDAERTHYAAVGSAQYRLTAGRLLYLDGRLDEARDALDASIAEVAGTIAWESAGAPSAYHAAAIAVRDEAQTELAKFADASPTPMPTSSSSPVATATSSATPAATATPSPERT